MSRDFKVVIPARYDSTRLPGKPLADLDGMPMVVRVARRAIESGAAEVLVATDDQRVISAVESAGCRACMTRSDHASGSDRVMEVAARNDWPASTVVVNVQGDEPFVPPGVIRQVAALLLDDPDVGVATLCEPITELADVFDPNVVKVVGGADGFARYFSRAPIPFARDAITGSSARSGPVPVGAAWYRHVGIYAFRLAALQQFVSWPVGRLEGVESLEQLRLVERGVGIRLAEAVDPVPGGIDTASDLARMREALARGD